MTDMTATTQTLQKPQSKLGAWLIRAGAALGSLAGLALLVPPPSVIEGDPTS